MLSRRALAAGLVCVAVSMLASVRAGAQNGTPPGARDGFVTVTSSGLRIHYVEWGPASAPPLVLVHGIDRLARTFDPLAPHFAGRYRVIAMDLRGHGDSGWDPDGRYLVDDHVGDLEALVRQLGLRGLTLWGNSTGGRVVQVFAGRHPDLVSAVIAEDVGPERPRSIADAYARRVKAEENGWASESELLARMRDTNPTSSDAVLQAYVRYGTKRRDDGRVVWKRDPNLVKGFVETELWSDVRRITAPILYLLGGRSTIVPAATQERLKNELPAVTIVTMPGLGHYPSDEKPAEVLAIVDGFLTSAGR